MSALQTRALNLARSLCSVALVTLIASCDGPATSSSAANLPVSSVPLLDTLVTPNGKLLFPKDYREWVFLSSGYGMSYAPGLAGAGDLPFDNVFVDPVSYKAFLKSGRWPEGTVFVLEIRPGHSQGSINRRGNFQQGQPIVVEVHAKDSRRFPTGWAFFSFAGRAPADRIPTTADCYSCHQANGAVDTTFVQFYPTLLPIAERKRSLASSYLNSLKGEHKANPR
jgi:Cytochrome P460